MDRHGFDKFRGVGSNPMVTSVMLHLLGSDNNLYAFFGDQVAAVEHLCEK